MTYPYSEENTLDYDDGTGQVLLVGNSIGSIESASVRRMLANATQGMMTKRLYDHVWTRKVYTDVCPRCGRRNFHWRTVNDECGLKIGNCRDCDIDVYEHDGVVYTQHHNECGYVVWFNRFKKLAGKAPGEFHEIVYPNR